MADAFAVATVAPKTERRNRVKMAREWTKTSHRGAREGPTEASGARET